MQYKLVELIKDLDVTVKGDENVLISGVCPIQQATPNHITFLTNSLYRKHLANTEAAAVILTEADAANCPVTAVISKNPYYVYAKMAAFFDKKHTTTAGIHPNAVVASDAQIDASASIGANCVIGARVKVAAGVIIGPGTVIGDDVKIGENSRLDANVTIYFGVKIGKRVHIYSGAVIGGDGFGLANDKGVWHKVPQLGSVDIGDDVDVGANTSIDRGAVEDTVIENGVKLDNLIQIAHNVRVGAHTVMAGCSAVAGSAVIGKYCMIGGASMIAGHVTIADKVIITGGTAVSSSIREPGMYSSGVVGVVSNLEFRKNNARFHRLESLMQRVKALESSLKELAERK